jgi:hypothetical protein
VENLLLEVREALTATPARWISLTTTISAAALEQIPAPGEWSAAQCLGHLIQTEKDVFPRRVRNFLAGEDISGFAPAGAAADYAQLSLPELAAEFARLRTQNLELIDGIQPTDLERSAVHSELGRVTLGQALRTWAAHDLNHTMQAERALMQPFIAGSGAWRIRFEEHVLPKSK